MKDVRAIAPKTANAGQPLADVATAGQPDREDFERLAEAGYRTVTDLPEPGEDRGLDEAEAIRQTRIAYVNIPVGHEDVDGETFERFRELMQDPERRPVLVPVSPGRGPGPQVSEHLRVGSASTLINSDQKVGPTWSGRLRVCPVHWVRERKGGS